MKKLISVIILFTLFSLNAFAATSSASFQVNNYIADTQYDPDIIQLNNGNIAIAWASGCESWQSCSGQDGSEFGVYAGIFDQSGNEIVSEFLVNEVTVGAQRYPVLTLLNDGSFLVAWNRYDGNGQGAFMRRYNQDGSEYIGGAFVGGELMITDTVAGSSWHPTITSLDNGGFVAVYSGSDSSSSGVFAKVFDNNGTSSGEFLVNQYTQGYQSLDSNSTTVDSLANGGFVVVWRGPDSTASGDKEVYARIYDDAGFASTNEFVVNNYTTGVQENPDVTALNDGGFIVMWVSVDEEGLFAKRFDQNGNVLESDFRIDSTVNMVNDGLLEDWYADITALTGGGYVIASPSVEDLGNFSQDIYTVYAQEYDENNNIVDSEFVVRNLGKIAVVEITELESNGYAIVSSFRDSTANSNVFADFFNIANPPNNTVPEFSSYVYFSVLLILGVAIRNRPLIDVEFNK